VILGDLVEQAPRLGEVAGRDGEPRDEPEALLLAVVQDLLGLAVRQVVEVLDADDRQDAAGGLDLLDGDLGQADVPDQAGVLQLLDGAEGFLDGDLGVDAVQLRARRPKYCALSNDKLRDAGVDMPPWQEALARYIARVG